MSLLSSDALMTNDTLRRRVDAAVRAEASSRRGHPDSPSTRLAQETYVNPGMATASFLLRLATNGGVVAEACEACGHAGGVPDDTIKWIVGDSWESIANELYTPTTPTTEEA